MHQPSWRPGKSIFLRGLVQDMRYLRAVIGLYDERRNTLTGWITLAEPPASR